VSGIVSESQEEGLQSSRNAVLHLALFVPWERFLDEPGDDIPRLWRSFEASLTDRVRSYVRNIALLRVSAEDARADSKLRGMDQDFEEVVDAQALDDPVEEEDGAGARSGGNAGSEDYYDAFLGVLSAVRESEIRDMPASSALRCLGEGAMAIDMEENDNMVAQRGRQFYAALQDIQDSPFRGMGLLSREEIDAVAKLQKKKDASVRAHIQGRESDESSAGADGLDGSPDGPRRPTQTGETETSKVRQDPVMRLEVGPYTSYIDIALGLTRKWTLNKLQSMAVLLPAAFLDARGTRLQDEDGRQHFQYVGGEGGTGKSRGIHAIKDMFRLKGGLHTLLLTGASGNAAALIGGVTLHSAANIGFEGRAAKTKNTSEEEKLRWKRMTMLIVDEISQVGGLTLAAVDDRLRQCRDDPLLQWHHVPVPLFQTALRLQTILDTSSSLSEHSQEITGCSCNRS
jgi:hypothetical protein